MAIIGAGGILELSREIPKPLVLSSSRLNFNATPISVSLSNQSYWTGDRVIIAADAGLPFDIDSNGYADSPDAHGFYRGSQFLTGPARVFTLAQIQTAVPFITNIQQLIL